MFSRSKVVRSVQKTGKTTGSHGTMRRDTFIENALNREDILKIRRRRGWAKVYATKTFFAISVFQRQLYRGDAAWPGRVEDMPGWEMKRRNSEYEDKFMSGKTDRLWGWKTVNYSGTAGEHIKKIGDMVFQGDPRDLFEMVVVYCKEQHIPYVVNPF